jgi:diguanylate cyclase (GGDEF)-like protein
MEDRPKSHSKRSLWLWTTLFLALHMASVRLFSGHADRLSAIFLVVAPLAAAIACGQRSRHSAFVVRRSWLFLALSLFIWSVASLLSAHGVFAREGPETHATASHIVYFLYGVPILWAITAPVEGAWNPISLWLDGLEVAIVGVLTFMITFEAMPFSEHLQPVPASMVVLTFNVENLFLACAATLRFVASPDGGRRSFFKQLTIFLWIYAVCSAIYNWIELAGAGPNYHDLLIDLPFLALIAYAVGRGSQPTAKAVILRTRLGLVLDNLAPIFFPASVLALGIFTIREHFVVGAVSLALSLSVYGIRSTLLQLAYQRAQSEARLARDNMEVLSLTDSLTGIGNRRHFDRVMADEWSRLSRETGTVSLLIIDIDYFKKLNDAFGHSEGDISLRQVASVLKASLQRERDCLARFGGEEFVILLPGANRSGVEATADRIRNTLMALKLRNRTPLGNQLTVSIGAASLHLPSGCSVAEFFAAADRALYRAKNQGRDRFEYETDVTFGSVHTAIE